MIGEGNSIIFYQKKYKVWDSRDKKTCYYVKKGIKSQNLSLLHGALVHIRKYPRESFEYFVKAPKGANMESWQSMAECTGLLIRHTMTIVS